MGKRVFSLGFLMLAILISNGCVSYSSFHDWSVETRANSVQFKSDGSVSLLAVDIGLLAYVKEHPFKASISAILDAGIVYGLGELWEEIKEEIEPPKPATYYVIRDNTFININDVENMETYFNNERGR